MVGAVERLDDDAALAEFVAPDAFEQLGVMLSLDPDPARRCDARTGSLGGQ
jgi:hypothetical protein